MVLHVQSICYIDNREFPGIEDMVASGPIGYQALTHHEAITITPNVMFFLNSWLADGLLVSSLIDPVPTRPGV